MSHSPIPLPARSDDDAPIELYYGNLNEDFGSAVISKMFLRFWPFLSVDGEHLNETDFALLVQVMAFHQDGELRVDSLPMKACLATRERTKTKLRRMGLVFTERVYYPTQPGKTPVMKCQRWDLRGLTYNLAQIARQWQVGQEVLLANWEGAETKGRRPVYSFPEGFRHEVVLPIPLAMDIVKGLFYPIPENWAQQARTLVAQMPTDTNPRGRRTDTNARDTPPTDTNPRGHLIDDDEEDDDLFAAVGGEKSDFSEVFNHFAQMSGKSEYQPNGRELKAFQKLVNSGISQASMLAGIEEVARTGKLSRARSITYCFPEIRRLAAGSVPALDSAPNPDTVSVVGSAPESSSVSAGSGPASVVAPTAVASATDSAPQTPAIPVYEIPENVRITFAQLFGRFPTVLECNQLHWLFNDHEQISQKQGENAWDWIVKAIRVSKPEVKEPIAYVRKVLEQQQKAHRRAKAESKNQSSHPSETKPLSQALAATHQPGQTVLTDGQTLRRPPKRSGYVIPSEVSQSSLADAVAMMFPDQVVTTLEEK